jgi:hypothetical protein
VLHPAVDPEADLVLVFGLGVDVDVGRPARERAAEQVDGGTRPSGRLDPGGLGALGLGLEAVGFGADRPVLPRHRAPLGRPVGLSPDDRAGRLERAQQARGLVRLQVELPHQQPGHLLPGLVPVADQLGPEVGGEPPGGLVELRLLVAERRRAHGEHGTGGVVDHLRGHAPHDHVRQPRPSVRAHGDQPDALFSGVLHDLRRRLPRARLADDVHPAQRRGPREAFELVAGRPEPFPGVGPDRQGEVAGRDHVQQVEFRLDQLGELAGVGQRALGARTEVGRDKNPSRRGHGGDPRGTWSIRAAEVITRSGLQQVSWRTIPPVGSKKIAPRNSGPPIPEGWHRIASLRS